MAVSQGGTSSGAPTGESLDRVLGRTPRARNDRKMGECPSNEDGGKGASGLENWNDSPSEDTIT